MQACCRVGDGPKLGRRERKRRRASTASWGGKEGLKRMPADEEEDQLLFLVRNRSDLHVGVLQHVLADVSRHYVSRHRGQDQLHLLVPPVAADNISDCLA